MLRIIEEDFINAPSGKDIEAFSVFVGVVVTSDCVRTGYGCVVERRRVPKNAVCRPLNLELDTVINAFLMKHTSKNVR
jgi:hypothetical protein